MAEGESIPRQHRTTRPPGDCEAPLSTPEWRMIESEARRSLARLTRALEKCARELEAVTGALRHVEGSDFPATAFDEATEHIRALEQFVDEQQQRLQEKILSAGGLEPGRLRRTGGT